MSQDSDLQRPGDGAATVEPAGRRGTDGRPERGGGPPQGGATAGHKAEDPGLRAGDRGGPASWIEASPGMPRSAEAISMADRRIARALGWFSLGIGIPQVLMPGRVNRLVGLENTLIKRQVMRLVGFREIATGAGIFFSQPKPAEWLWARAGGDLMDLLMLKRAFGNPMSRKGRLLLATADVAVIGALDVIQARKHSRALKESGEESSMKARSSITVNRPADEVYRRWRDFENLPQFMFHLQAVEPKGERRHRWVAKAPMGNTVEWDAEVIEDIPNELIAWRAVDGADVPNSGSVRFVPAPGGRGTEVIVEVDYQLPGGAIGGTVARLFGEEPEQQIKDDLRRFKQVVETGEVVYSEANPRGTISSHQIPKRPARPLP
ncbi:MAG TPA: SRPBCC family protein [Actinomycetota bacterium]|nr:SRPBCC family protein [Actinomycetota bacterium]